MKMKIEEKIYNAIMMYASTCAKKFINSMEEVEIIYNNKDCPALNKYIDYILRGK